VGIVAPPGESEYKTATYWLKIAFFHTPLFFGAPAPYLPSGISRWS